MFSLLSFLISVSVVFFTIVRCRSLENSCFLEDKASFFWPYKNLSTAVDGRAAQFPTNDTSIPMGFCASMSFEVEPPQKKKKTNPSPPSFLSLPDVIVVNCLARISRSYYPKLSLVCKTFRSYVSSNELRVARFHNKTTESFVHVCLQLPDHHRPSWFTLWMKPDQTLTNDLTRRKNRSLRNTLLVPTPSSYYWCQPYITVTLGSEYYALKQCHPPSTDMLVCNKDEIWQWRKTPNMIVARESAIACTLDSKIYVMGGCAAEESTNWAEVFDTNTQTWEPLPDPGAELRFSSIISVQEVTGGKLRVRSNQKKDYTYDPKEGKWDVVGETPACCVVEDICYSCDRQSCLWYDAKRKEWRRVRGLAKLNKKPRRGMIEIATYRGKLLILWDKFAHGGPGGGCRYKNIWCAVIALEKRNGDEVRGNVEWANVVLTVPDSYVFLRSTVLRA